jgi:capsule polysaccharide export protein KpsC/LpsZ
MNLRDIVRKWLGIYYAPENIRMAMETIEAVRRISEKNLQLSQAIDLHLSTLLSKFPEATNHRIEPVSVPGVRVLTFEDEQLIALKEFEK